MRKLLLVAAALASSAAFGQGFTPSRPVEAVVHTGPGGGSDLLARAVALMIEKENLLPVRLQVVNKTGGGGAVAAAYLAEKRAIRTPSVFSPASGSPIRSPAPRPRSRSRTSLRLRAWFWSPP